LGSRPPRVCAAEPPVAQRGKIVHQIGSPVEIPEFPAVERGDAGRRRGADESFELRSLLGLAGFD
jgi:hypothetical protein